MYNDLLNKKFDYVIFGTSLTESILSAYLAKSRKKILILESSNSYGGDCKTFNLKYRSLLIFSLVRLQTGKMSVA